MPCWTAQARASGAWSASTTGRWQPGWPCRCWRWSATSTPRRAARPDRGDAGAGGAPALTALQRPWPRPRREARDGGGCVRWRRRRLSRRHGWVRQGLKRAPKFTVYAVVMVALRKRPSSRELRDRWRARSCRAHDRCRELRPRTIGSVPPAAPTLARSTTGNSDRVDCARRPAGVGQPTCHRRPLRCSSSRTPGRSPHLMHHLAIAWRPGHFAVRTGLNPQLRKPDT